MSNVDLTILILTFNEEANIRFALENVKDLTENIYILDSGSTDNTLEIAKEFGCKTFHRDFDNFSNQRNYGLKELEYSTEWVFVLDADEWLTDDCKTEIAHLLTSNQPQTYDAFMLKRRFYWMGTWVKRGYYPTWLVRLGRVGKLECDDRGINEHMVCTTGKIGKLNGDFVDENHKDISAWLDKHNKYSSFEANRLIEEPDTDYSFWKNQYERKRWIRVHIWNKLPAFSRPFLYFFYRMFIRMGILDGRRAVLYHFLHAFIYRAIIDAKLIEARSKRQP